MRRQEKRRKFHEAVINMLYPPPSPSSPPPPKDEDVPLSILSEDFEAEELGKSGSSTTSGEDDGGDGESGPQRLTRAQRKRLRKKKLKEDASRRREIIGPLLPSTVDEGQGEAQGVRRNASVEPDAAAAVEKPGDDETPACSNQNKVKQRRKAKKLAREREQD